MSLNIYCLNYECIFLIISPSLLVLALILWYCILPISNLSLFPKQRFFCILSYKLLFMLRVVILIICRVTLHMFMYIYALCAALQLYFMASAYCVFIYANLSFSNHIQFYAVLHMYWSICCSIICTISMCTCIAI